MATETTGFWTNNYAEDGTLTDPKRKFRFKVSMTNFTGDATSTVWYAKTVTKPSFQIATTEHKYLNHTFYYPGTVTWQDVTITMVDPAGTKSNVAKLMSTVMEGSGYAVPADPSMHTTVTKSKASFALGAVIITQMDGEGKDLETWTLNNAFVTEMKYGDLEYGADDLMELSMTLKYDWASLATYEPAGTAHEDFFSKVSSTA